MSLIHLGCLGKQGHPLLHEDTVSPKQATVGVTGHVARAEVRHTVTGVPPAGRGSPTAASRFPTPTQWEDQGGSPHPDGETDARQGVRDEAARTHPRAPLPTHHGLAASERYPGSPALSRWPAGCLTLGINISHFTLEEFASHRPPWQQPSFPHSGVTHNPAGVRPGCHTATGCPCRGRPPLVPFWK